MKKIDKSKDFKTYLRWLAAFWVVLMLFVLAPLTRYNSFPTDYMGMIDYIGLIIIAVGLLFAVIPFWIVAKIEIDRLNKL